MKFTQASVTAGGHFYQALNCETITVDWWHNNDVGHSQPHRDSQPHSWFPSVSCLKCSAVLCAASTKHVKQKRRDSFIQAPQHWTVLSPVLLENLYFHLSLKFLLRKDFFLVGGNKSTSSSFITPATEFHVRLFSYCWCVSEAAKNISLNRDLEAV